MNDTIDKELEKLREKRLQKLMEDTGEEKGSKGGVGGYPGEPVPITDANFKEFVARYPLVVVDCWAPWCAPCRMLAPIFEELAKDYKGRIVFGKLNVDENPRAAMFYQTMSIPTMLVFKHGGLVDRIVGALPRPMIEQKLVRHLNTGE